MFVRACAVKMHMDISQGNFCAETSPMRDTDETTSNEHPTLTLTFGGKNNSHRKGRFSSAPSDYSLCPCLHSDQTLSKQGTECLLQAVSESLPALDTPGHWGMHRSTRFSSGKKCETYTDGLKVRMPFGKNERHQQHKLNCIVPAFQKLECLPPT